MRALILASLLLPTAALAQPGAPPPPPPPGYAPAPAPGYGPAYAQQPQNHKHGMTFEANLGLGFIWTDPDGGAESDKEAALAGLNIGIGGWLNPNLAITVRIAGVTYSEDVGNDTARLSAGFFGPSAQYWVNENTWLGGGLGLGFARITYAGDSDSETGTAVDLRAGYTFSTTSENTWNLSLELTPSFFDGGTIYGFGILFGYQHL